MIMIERLRPLIPLVTLVLFSCGYVALSALVGRLPGGAEGLIVESPARAVDVGRIVDEVLYRNLWIAIVLALVATGVAICVFSFRVVVDAGCNERVLAWSTAVVSLLALGAILWPSNDLFRAYFRHAAGDGIIAPDRLVRAVYGVALIPTVQVAVAVGALTSIKPAMREPGVFRERLAQLRTLLRLGSMLLVLGVLTTFAIWSWGAVTFAEDIEFRRVAMAQAMAGGILWTVLLGAIFLPAGSLLHEQARAACREATPEDESAWLKAAGIDGDVGWRELVAIAGPLVAGAVAPWMETLVGRI